jgi:2-deoxy-D-gluconate 3-dehydrogenase
MDPPGRPLASLIDFTGKVAIVTGAGQGLGFAVAARLAEAGAAVVLFDRDGERVVDAATRLREAGRTVSAVAGDVAHAHDVDRLVEATLREHGRVDVLVNNAGIWPREPFLDAPEELWRRTLEVNLLGTLLCSRAVARELVRQGEGGAIVNISSIAAVVPHPDELVAYGASKAGVTNATRTLAKALAPHRIRVNALLPGGMETPGVQGQPRRQGSDIPLGHRADPDEVATAVLFLASGLAGYVTGAELVVDGGATLV